MKRIQASVAILCCFVLVFPMVAQSPSTDSMGAREPMNGKWYDRLAYPYEKKEVPAVHFGNSPRIESLIRAGNIYLSLQDAIALALENNLDIELQRYGPKIAQTDVLRASAGSLLQGINTSVQPGPQGVTSGGTGVLSANSLLGSTSASSGSTTGGSFGGLSIQRIGSTIPNLDPVVASTIQWYHQSTPLSSSLVAGQNVLLTNSNAQNFSVTEGFLTGTNVQWTFNNSGAYQNSINNTFNPFRQGNMSIAVSQNLLQGFGLAVNNRNIRIAKNDLKVADLTFRQQVIETVSAIIGLYWDLVSYSENVKNKKEALAVAQKLYDDNKKQVEIGSLAPIEIVRAEAEVANNQQALTVAETQVLQQETILKNVLSKSGVANPLLAETHIIPTDRIPFPDIEPVQPIQDLVAKAMANRPELESAEIQIQNSRIGLTGLKSALLPTLSVYAIANDNGLAGQPNTVGMSPSLPPSIAQLLPGSSASPYFVGGTGTVLSQIFSRNFPDYGAGFSLSFPLRNRSAQADMIQTELNLRQQEISQRKQINQVRVDVQNAMIGVQQARAGYVAANKARVYSDEVLDAEQKKYELGASTIFLVVSAQRDLAQARWNEVVALSQYARAKVTLDQVAGQTLDRYDISIAEALRGQISRPPSPLPVLDMKP
jgi:outer membrane protein TolC